MHQGDSDISTHPYPCKSNEGSTTHHCSFREGLIKHLMSVHSMQLTCETKKFVNFDEFDTFEVRI